MDARRPASIQLPACAASALLPLSLLLGAGLLAAQKVGSDEVTAQESEATFKLQVERNLVVVRAVVRDSSGRAVGGLHKEDFHLFDNGKLQTLSQFSLESTVPQSASREPLRKSVDEEALPETALSPVTPRRYLALYFDDAHADFEGLARTREAAKKYLASNWGLGDRVGVFTSSGQGNLDFTDDRGELLEALQHLLPRSMVTRDNNSCPKIFDYQAYLIVERHELYATQTAIEEALECHYKGDTRFLDQATSEAQAEALRKLNEAENVTEYALRSLDALVRRMTQAPGQRTLVLISPGFMTETEQHRLNEIIDHALRSGVIVNSLDSRGLYAQVPLGDASEQTVFLQRNNDLMGHKAQMYIDGDSLNSKVLRALATDTGGIFFHNSNDFDEGFRKTGALPEVYYVLAYSPQNLKYDGRFHSLKVKLADPRGYSVQAREGYFAPQKPLDSVARAKEEIEQALFSQDELAELPMEVHTQFFKANDLSAKLSVLMHLDLHFVQFKKSEGRNLNNLTVVTALFDRNGNYLAGKERRLEFRLRDTSLEQLTQSGLTMKTSFEVKPGTYLVREVVRDAAGERISGLTRTVDIPY
jgi:VWFA-related protein